MMSLNIHLVKNAKPLLLDYKQERSALYMNEFEVKLKAVVLLFRYMSMYKCTYSCNLVRKCFSPL